MIVKLENEIIQAITLQFFLNSLPCGGGRWTLGSGKNATIAREITNDT